MDSSPPIALDLRQALRSLRLRKAFAAAVAITLGLGIGAVCLVFSIVDSVLVRPLDFPNARQLVWIGWQSRGDRSPVGPSLDDEAVWTANSRAFSGIAGYAEQLVQLRVQGELHRIPAALVAGSFFQVLGNAPVIGRWSSPEEDIAGAHLAVVLSYDGWLSLFAGDSTVVGRSLEVDDVSATIVGVMRPNFSFPSTDIALWLPMRAKLPTIPNESDVRLEGVIGRFHDGSTRVDAEHELFALSRRARTEDGSPTLDRTVRAVPLQEVVVGDVSRTLLLLLGASVLVLCAACINAGGLLVSREVGRRGELALRRALGAGTGQLLRTLSVESCLLALAGAFVGIVLITQGLPLVRRFARDLLPRATELSVNGHVLLLALALAGVTTLAVALLATMVAASTRELNLVGAQSHGLSLSRRLTVARRIVICAQLATTMVVLAGAGLLGKSVAQLVGGVPGISSEHIVTAHVQRSVEEWLANKERTGQFASQMMAQLDASPGIKMSALSLGFPTEDHLRGWMRRADETGAASDTASVAFQVATGSYFATLGIPLLEGRVSDVRDAHSDPRTLIVSESVARRLFGGSSAVGKRVFARGNDEDASNVDSAYEIIGVVGDVRAPGPARTPIEHVYIPFERYPVPGMTLFVRSSLSPAIEAPAVQRIIRALNVDEAAPAVRALDDVLAQSAARPRFYLLLLGTFGVLSLLLTAIGIYGMTSYSTRQRRRELGVRIALGADRGSIMELVLLENLGPMLIGVAVGLLGSLAASRLLVGLLSGVNPTDPVVLFTVALVLVGAGMLATLSPALEAARVDPLVALRTET